MRIYLLILSCLVISLTARGADAPQPQNPQGLPPSTEQKPVALPNPPIQKEERSGTTSTQPAATTPVTVQEEVVVTTSTKPGPTSTDTTPKEEVVVTTSAKQEEAIPAPPAGRVVKVNPRVRITSLSVTPSIPLEVIRPFLSGTRIVNQSAIHNTPYIVAARDNSILFGSDEEVLVKWLRRPGIHNYSVFRIGHPYVNPRTKEILGYEALDLGFGTIVQWGDPSVVRLYDTNQEVVVGDRLLPQDNSNLRTKYVLHRPAFPVYSSILAVLNGITLVGQYSVVVIVGGSRDGLIVGDRLGIYTNHPPFQDPLDEKCKSMIYPPKELAGELLVFRTFEKLSLGVVLKAHKTIEVADNVSNL